MSVHLRKIESDEHLTEAFSYFDKNQSGYVEFEELKDALSDDESGPSNDQVIRDILNDVDLDKVTKLVCLTSIPPIGKYCIYLVQLLNPVVLLCFVKGRTNQF